MSSNKNIWGILEKAKVGQYLDIYFVILLFTMISLRKNILVSLTVFGAVLGLLILIKNWKRYISFLINSRYLYVVLAFLIPVGIAGIDSLYPEKKFKVFNTLFLYMLIGVLPIYMLYHKGNFKRLELLTVLGVLYISVDAIVQWLTGYHTFGYHPQEGNRIQGVFLGWYHLSYFLATFSPVLFFYFFKYIEYRLTWARLLLTLVAFFVFILGIMLGGARAGLISLGVSIVLFIIYLLYQNKIKNRLWFFGGVGAILAVSIIIVSFIPEVQQRYFSILSQLGEDGFWEKFTSSRPNIWYVGFNEVPNYLMNGVGVRGFNNLYLSYPESYKIYDYVDHPHLHGLEVLIETGLIGFIPYCITCIYLLVRMFTAKAGNMWLMMGFVAIMPINSHVPLYQNYWLPLEWVPIMLGLILAYGADPKISAKSI